MPIAGIYGVGSLMEPKLAVGAVVPLGERSREGAGVEPTLAEAGAWVGASIGSGAEEGGRAAFVGATAEGTIEGDVNGDATGTTRAGVALFTRATGPTAGGLDWKPETGAGIGGVGIMADVVGAETVGVGESCGDDRKNTKAKTPPTNRASRTSVHPRPTISIRISRRSLSRALFNDRRVSNVLSSSLDIPLSVGPQRAWSSPYETVRAL
jgi:hypothetical protein